MFFPFLLCLEIVGWGLVWGRGIEDSLAWIKEIGLLSLRGSVSGIKRECRYLFNPFCGVLCKKKKHCIANFRVVLWGFVFKIIYLCVLRIDGYVCKAK
ncbi:MAG: hypothetical protein H6Q15_1220 [Bacteroidetes bacterium]|nr:hypothetical protein [Bacteroidota bacterium]